MAYKKYLVFIVLLGSILAGFSSYWFSLRVFHRAPLTTDEQSYLLQATIFSEGRIKYEPPPIIQPFRYPMIVVDAEKGWFSRYPPGHSLWLVPGVWLQNPYIMVALAAALGVLLMGLVAWRTGAHVPFIVLLLLVSPFYVFTYGTLMSHVSGFVASASMLLAYILWQQTGRLWWALIAGLAWGWLFLNRTYTAFLLAIPFAMDALWFLWRQRDRRALSGTVAFAGAAAFGVFLLLGYNYFVLGHPLKMTYLYYDPTDNLGFGLRHNGPVFPAPEPVMHTPQKALNDLGGNLLLLDRWLFGFPGGLAVWLVLAVVGWLRRWSLLMVGCLISVPLGYLLFWYPGWNQTGPNYYFEIFPMLLLPAALGMTRFFAMASRWPKTRALVPIAVMLAWGSLLSFFYRDQIAFFKAETHERGEVLSVMQSASEPTLLFIRQEIVDEAWPNHDLVFSPDGVEGDTIVARWNETWNRALAARFPGHRPALLIKDGDNYQIDYLDELPPFFVDFRIGSLHRTTGHNKEDPDNPGGLIRYAAENDSKGRLLFGRRVRLFPGSFVLEVEARSMFDDLALIDLIFQQGSQSVVRAAVPASDDWNTIRLPFICNEHVSAEPQVHFLGGGQVEIRRVTLFESVSSADQSRD